MAHSTHVTPDFVGQRHKFLQRPCIFFLQEGGENSRWFEWVHFAAKFYQKNFDVVMVDIPTLKSPSHWLRAAPMGITALIHHMHIKKVHLIAYGCGAEMAVKCLLTYPKVYQRKHILFNYDTSQFSTDRRIYEYFDKLNEMLRGTEERSPGLQIRGLKFQTSKFKFKFPRARTFELHRASSRLYQNQNQKSFGFRKERKPRRVRETKSSPNPSRQVLCSTVLYPI